MREHNRTALLRLATYYGTGAATTFVTGAVAIVIAEAVYPGQDYPNPLPALLGFAAIGGPAGVLTMLAAWSARDLWQVRLRPAWRRWVNHRWLVGEARRQGVKLRPWRCNAGTCERKISTFQRILTGRCSRHRWPR